MYIKIKLSKKMDNFIILNKFIGTRSLTINKAFVKNLSDCNLKGNINNGYSVQVPSEQLINMESCLEGFISNAKFEAIPNKKLAFIMDDDVYALPLICNDKVVLVNHEYIKMIEESLISVKYFSSGEVSQSVVIAKCDNEVVAVFCGMRYTQDRMLKAVQLLANTETCKVYENV